MGTPQKESFNSGKGYKSVVWIKGRDAQDWGLNEMEAQQDFERARLANRVYKNGAIAEGMLTKLGAAGVITVADGMMQFAGRIESVPGATLNFDALKTTGVDTIYARWLLDQVTAVQDATLVAPATGNVVEERIRTAVTLTATSPDALDEAFETWNGSVPLGWTLNGGTSEKGYPARFGETALQLNHINGVQTQLTMANLTVTPFTAYYVYFAVRTADGQPNLSIADGAHCDITRSSPAFHPSDFTFATSRDNFTLKPFTFQSDANSEQVSFRITIPSGAPTTKILIDAILVTSAPLGQLDLDRHYVPMLYWDRGTNKVVRAIDRTSNLKMAELEPPLDGRDIINIDLNQTLNDMLAQRTFDGHGNFRVPPALMVNRDTSTDTATTLGLRVKPGRGYVAGFPIGKPTSTAVAIAKATTTAPMNLEGKTYNLGTQRYDLAKAVSLDDFPVKQISQVNATLEKVLTITRGGTADGTDALGVTGVLSILAVTQGSSTAILDGTVATTFVITPTTNTFTMTVTNYDGTAGSAQTLVFARGSFTTDEVVAALNTASGRAYRSGKITGNVLFSNVGGVVRIATKTISDYSTILIGSANANAALGFTNAATNTGVGTTGHSSDGRYVATTDYTLSGNSIAWTPTGGGSAEPAGGSSYSVIVRYAANLAINAEYVLAGKFDSQLTRYYIVTALGASGEGVGFTPGIGRLTPAGSINLISWTALANAESYNVYRSDNGVGGTYNLIRNVVSNSLIDDYSIPADSSKHPGTVSTTVPGTLSGGETTLTVVSTAGFSTVNPSTAFIDGSDIFTYTGVTGTTFTGCSGIVAHAAGVTVRMGPNGTANSVAVVESELGVVNLSPSVGTFQVDGTTFLVSYEYYQPRTDQVVVDRNGTISVIQGVPADLPLPPAVPSDVMALAQVQPRANATTVNIVNYSRIDRPTVMDLRVLFERVQTLFENDIIQQQINQIADITPTAKKGLFADAQANLAQHDPTHALYALSLDTTLRVATVPNTVVMTTPTVNAGPTTAVLRANDRLIPSTEVTLLHQSKWSELTDVNEFAVFTVPPAVVSLNPPQMSWSFQTAFAGGHQANLLLHAMAQGLIAPAGGVPPWILDLQTARLGASRQVAESLIKENSALVAAFLTRVTTITVTGVLSMPLEDNIAGTFASQPVTLTPVSPTVAGTVAGTVKADSTGRWSATFTIPISIGLGVHDFRAKGPSTDASASFSGINTVSLGYQPQGEFAYQWITNQGYGHADQNGNFVPGWDPVACPTDPLAQSIFIDSDQTLSAVGVWFGAKDATLPICVQLRNMNGGFPGAVVLASKVLDPSEITLNVETKVQFDEYVSVPANRFVCIVLITSANTYKVQTATLRKIALSNAGVQVGAILENPYLAGVLLSSSNLNTWTPKQETDLRMKVYGRSFSPSAVLEFTSVSVASSDIFIGANQRLPSGTDIQWEYELNGNAVIMPFNIMEKRRLEILSSSIIMRARLTTTNPRVSPLINIPSVGLVTFTNALAGGYVSRMVEFTQNLVKATLYVNAAIPATTTVTWQVSNDDGVTWETPTLDSTTAIDGKWSAYVLTRTFTTNTNKQFRMKAILGAANAIVIPELGAVGVTFE